MGRLFDISGGNSGNIQKKPGIGSDLRRNHPGAFHSNAGTAVGSNSVHAYSTNRNSIDPGHGNRPLNRWDDERKRTGRRPH